MRRLILAKADDYSSLPDRSERAGVFLRTISFLFAERNGSYTPKKGDKGKFPLDPSQKSKSKGAAGVAAIAVTRGW